LYRKTVDQWADVLTYDEQAGTMYERQIPILGLPAALGSTSLPPTFLSRFHERKAKALPGTRLRVGVNWQGSTAHRNDKHRSMPWETFKRALPEGIEVVNLCREHPAGDVPPADFSHFGQTRDMVLSCDLVVTVDTGVAHLAADLGVPTWVMVAVPMDWRWGRPGVPETPWYPMMTLYWQKQPGDWAPVLKAVHDDLEMRR
jgi:hypothetical protein